MNLQMPTHEEIKIAYQEGEASVIALFDQVNAQVILLAQALEKQAGAIEELRAKLAKDSSR